MPALLTRPVRFPPRRRASCRWRDANYTVTHQALGFVSLAGNPLLGARALGELGTALCDSPGMQALEVPSLTLAFPSLRPPPCAATRAPEEAARSLSLASAPAQPQPSPPPAQRARDL
jgi:hypothetical protein